MAIMQQGMNQQTPAILTLLRSVNRSTSSAGRRTKRGSGKRKSASTRKSGSKAKKKRAAKPARFVKGSAAAKRYMASIRKKRK